jgi:hypothetical protein
LPADAVLVKVPGKIPADILFPVAGELFLDLFAADLPVTPGNQQLDNR